MVEFPDKIWALPRNHKMMLSEYDCKPESSGTEYIRYDIHAELQDENDRLRESIKRRAIMDIERLVEWLNADEDNSELLLASLTPEELEYAHAVLKQHPHS